MRVWGYSRVWGPFSYPAWWIQLFSGWSTCLAVFPRVKGKKNVSLFFLFYYLLFVDVGYKSWRRGIIPELGRLELFSLVIFVYSARGPQLKFTFYFYFFFTFSSLYFYFFTFKIGFPSSENKRVGRGWGGGGFVRARPADQARFCTLQLCLWVNNQIQK